MNTTTTVKVTKLTADNVAALNQAIANGDLTGWTVAKTTATYDGTQEAAYTSVQQVMDGEMAMYAKATSIYRSLVAVRNKLNSGDSPHVKVIEVITEPAPAATADRRPATDADLVIGQKVFKGNGTTLYRIVGVRTCPDSGQLEAGVVKDTTKSAPARWTSYPASTYTVPVGTVPGTSTASNDNFKVVMQEGYWIVAERYSGSRASSRYSTREEAEAQFSHQMYWNKQVAVPAPAPVDPEMIEPGPPVASNTYYDVIRRAARWIVVERVSGQRVSPQYLDKAEAIARLADPMYAQSPIGIDTARELVEYCKLETADRIKTSRDHATLGINSGRYVAYLEALYHFEYEVTGPLQITITGRVPGMGEVVLDIVNDVTEQLDYLPGEFEQPDDLTTVFTWL